MNPVRILYLDCFSGISGDMFVGSLLDLGWSLADLQAGLSLLGLDAEFHIHASHQNRQNISATKFDVHVAHHHPHAHHTSPSPHSHTHSHFDEEHHHSSATETHSHTHGRTFREIQTLIEASQLSKNVKTTSISVFRRIAVAEGKIHGQPPEKVAFHEVGAIDSIVDIVGVCLGIEALGIQEIHASKLAEGSGMIQCAHGIFPLPAPATLEILRGIPLSQVEEAGERITPTGAALLAEFAQSFGPMPELRVEKTGFGAGARNPATRPNVLRAILGESVFSALNPTKQVVEIQTNLDDSTPELVAEVSRQLMLKGALDVFTQPIMMKKGRVGVLLTVLAHLPDAERLSHLILRESTAFGVRWQHCERVILDRKIIPIETPFGSVQVKIGALNGEILQCAPEFSSCVEVAEKVGVSFREVFSATQGASELAKGNFSSLFPRK